LAAGRRSHQARPGRSGETPPNHRPTRWTPPTPRTLRAIPTLSLPALKVSASAPGPESFVAMRALPATLPFRVAARRTMAPSASATRAFRSPRRPIALTRSSSSATRDPGSTPQRRASLSPPATGLRSPIATAMRPVPSWPASARANDAISSASRRRAARRRSRTPTPRRSAGAVPVSRCRRLFPLRPSERAAALRRDQYRKDPGARLACERCRTIVGAFAGMVA
jgi:hypothetical protein